LLVFLLICRPAGGFKIGVEDDCGFLDVFLGDFLECLVAFTTDCGAGLETTSFSLSKSVVHSPGRVIFFIFLYRCPLPVFVSSKMGKPDSTRGRFNLASSYVPACSNITKKTILIQCSQ
jgi:hypothetical protein